MAASEGVRSPSLRFRAEEGDVERFKKAIAAVTGGERSWPEARLSERCFDTRDGRLASRGVAYSVRRANGTVIQAVDANGPGDRGTSDHGEWQQPVAGTEPEPDALPIEARRAMGAVLDSELAAVARIDVARQATTLRREDAVGADLLVEATADRGTVKAAGRSQPFNECGLTLLRGDIGAFYQLAAEVHAACPLPLAGAPPAELGQQVLSGAGPTAHKVPRFDVSGDSSVHQALADIYATCIANILDNEATCLDGRDPEGVHQMRVSIRRLRSSLKVFRDYIGPARTAWMGEELKWLGNRLGPARDWDVYVQETLGSIAGFGIDQKALDSLRNLAQRKRETAYAQVRETLRSERYARMMFRLAAFVALEGWLPRPLDPDEPLLHPLRKAASGILRRPYRKLMKEAQDLANLDTEARHAVRIRLKKLRYAVDFLQGVYPSTEARKFTRALRDLQDEFGHLNDVAQAMRLTDELTQPAAGGNVADQVLLAAGQVRGWYARALQDANPRLLANWDALAAVSPFWKGKP